jgi:Tol biopolymer transport system component/ABC-type branched-subunit amino acid transport system substrate-binding protein
MEETMDRSFFRVVLILTVAAMILAACNAPASVPAAPTPEPASTAAPAEVAATDTPAPASQSAAQAAMPFSHTACASGVDLTGQTVSFYHMAGPGDQVDTVYDPLHAGYADAAEYLNAHGGICGAQIEQVWDEKDWNEGQDAVYAHYASLNPKPVAITMVGSGMPVQLADRLAADQIVGVDPRAGSTESAYGDDQETLGWTFDTNPTYADQAAAFCDYVATNPDRFPNPAMGFISFDVGTWIAAGEEPQGYCASRGVKIVGASYFPEDATNIRGNVQSLIDAGANILYINSHGSGAALVAKTIADMGLKGKVTFAGNNRTLDAYMAFAGEKDLDANGVPVISGMLGSLPLRSLAETDHPGVQVMNAQADKNHRPVTMRADAYILGWTTTDLLAEAYIQTGNRVGFDKVTGAEFKKTLENIVYAPLGGVGQVDFQGGKRRALAANRIGQMNYLGKDGKTPAGPGNPPLVVKVGDQDSLVPMILPLTDFAPAPETRPGAANFVEATPMPELLVATPTPSAASAPVSLGTEKLLATVKGRMVFYSNRSGNNEIYVMNGDGTGLTNLTNNPADDVGPIWSPDGSKIAFSSDRDGNYEVYVMNADGSGLTNLTNSPASEGGSSTNEDISWSPDGKKILFASDRDGNPEIYVMNADGSGQTNLTNNPAGDIFPEWSTDGKQIGFTTDRSGNDEIYLMNADGSNPTRLTNNSRADDAFPRWSPDGKKIAYVHGYGSGTYEIYLMNADGSNPVQLTDNQGPRDDNMDPHWSLDGTQIIFWSSRDGNEELYLMNADGSNQTRITDNPANDDGPMWKPEPPAQQPVSLGTEKLLATVKGRILFGSNRSGNNEIYVMNGDGTGLTNLTNNSADDVGPVWSPNGEKIAFLTNRDGNYEVYVMNADGSNPTNLTNNPADEGFSGLPTIDWSPDGVKIVFASDRDGNHEIYVMNADGSQQTDVTKTPKSDEIMPYWSPDGKRIAYSIDNPSNWDIYFMDPDGSNPVRITTSPVDDYVPRWSPDGEKIAYIHGHGDGTDEIYVMNKDGSNPTPLTDSPEPKVNNRDPRWSRDGKQIIFTSSRDGNDELYVMNADGSNQTRLTENLANEGSPSWQPEPQP